MTDPTRVEIVLESGLRFSGQGWGDFSKARGAELVFSTAMSGIEESLTDPSYAGQFLLSTASHVGNTGINRHDMESEKVWAEALFCRHLEKRPSSWRSQISLGDWMQEQGRFVVEGIDTRALTIHLRENGSQRALVYEASSMDSAQARNLLLTSVSPMKGRFLSASVSCKESYNYTQRFPEQENEYYPLAGSLDESLVKTSPKKLLLWDFGVKKNISKILNHLGYQVEVIPSSTSAAEILQAGPDALFLSNGPGDPSAADSIVGQLKELVGVIPIMGICMGHQLLARALGASTKKMKFGHRGIHHPVVELDDNGEVKRTWITSQNHGFEVDENSLPPGVRVIFKHADDGSVEGIESKEKRCFSVQFHPEAAPGPTDAVLLFDRLRELCQR